MSFQRGSGGGVSPSRSVALDLILRTFMNSSQFHASRPRVWENVSRLVPGTTPQQCYERWEELRRFADSSTSRDCSELTAYGRPVSQKLLQHRQSGRGSRTLLRSPSSQAALGQSPQSVGDVALPRPLSRSEGSVAVDCGRSESHAAHQGTVRLGEEEGSERGSNFVTSFYQNMLENEQKTERECKNDSVDAKEVPLRSNNSVSDGPNPERLSGRGSERVPVTKPETTCNESDIIIHVFDEQRKSKREFYCPRAVLVREMRYFAEYLSSDGHLLDEVDISVHCDIPVFDWLVRYAKRGLDVGPRGETLEEPLEPAALETDNVVSILISSDFLKMDSLVEECLTFCHENLSAVLASPTNVGCISDRLRERLASKFTATELEGVVDRKDKMKSKLFIHQIQQLFSPTHSHSQCPASATTLYKCRYCEKLLTSEQTALLPCTENRLEVHFDGQVVYCHERDENWSVTGYLSSLQKQHRLSPRDIYWRLWGVVNWLRCATCGQAFQCRDLGSCHYHSQPALSGRSSTGPPVHICCGSPPASASPFPLPQSGCCVQDHTVADPQSPTVSLLLAHRDIICSGPTHPGESDSRRKERDTHESLSSKTNNSQLSFLRTAELWAPRRACQPCSETATGQRVREKKKESRVDDRSLRTVAKERDVTKMSLLARKQALSEVSELEEDEEEEEERINRRPHPLQTGVSSGGSSKHTHKRESSKSTSHHHQHHHSTSRRTRHSSAPAIAMDWIWDSQKTQRWNQDRQRENDERRLALLCDKMARVSAVPSTNSRERDTTSYAGGIFAQLEAQFRAHQAVRPLPQPPLPLTHHHTSTGSRLPGRKR